MCCSLAGRCRGQLAAGGRVQGRERAEEDWEREGGGEDNETMIDRRDCAARPVWREPASTSDRRQVRT